MAGGLFGDCVDQEDLQIFICVSLELLFFFPFQVPQASASIIHGPHHILVTAPCSNKGAICPVSKPIQALGMGLKRKQAGPSASNYQELVCQHSAFGIQPLCYSSSGSPDTGLPCSRPFHFVQAGGTKSTELFLTPCMPWQILCGLVWMSFCTNVEIIDSDPFTCSCDLQQDHLNAPSLLAR